MDKLGGGTARSDDLRRIRDLVSHPPLHAGLMEDLDSWLRLCAGLDGITDADDVAGHVAALDSVRRELGMEPTIGDADELALAAGLSAVRAELEERVKHHHAAFAQDPLAAHLDHTVDYFLERTAEAVGAMTPTATESERDALDYNRAWLETLTDHLNAVDDALQQRGFDPDVRYTVRQALYICDRARELLDGAAGAPDATDADVLVTVALPVLVDRVRSLAREIDADYAASPPGWSPPLVE